MLTMALLAAMAAEAAVVVKARSTLAHTRTLSHVVGHYTGDLPASTISVDPRALMLNPEVIEATSGKLAPSLPPAAVADATTPRLGGGTSTETFAAVALPPEMGPSAAGTAAAPSSVPQTRLASLELPVLPLAPPAPSEATAGIAPSAPGAATNAPDKVLAMLSPPPLAGPRPPVELTPAPAPPIPDEPPLARDTGTPDQILAMQAPQPLPVPRPPADARPSPSEPPAAVPMFEPHMEVFEDWVTRAPMNRHPGFYKVHFAPNVQGRCLPKTLINVLYDVGMKFGDVKVISGYRSPSHNRAVGGATRSLHMECRAIDFFVAGTGSGVVDWLIRRKDVGGYKRYPFGSFHIDNGPRRTWSWGKRKRRR